MPDPNDQINTIIPILQKNKGTYYKLNTLSTMTGIAPEVIVNTASLHPELVRKSQIELEDGKPLYILNTPLSGVKDAWATIRHIAYLKTQ
jgi:hypothetical protein